MKNAENDGIGPWWEQKAPKLFPFDETANSDLRIKFTYNDKVNEVIGNKDRVIVELKRQLAQKKEELSLADMTIKKKDRLLAEVRLEIRKQDRIISSSS